MNPMQSPNTGVDGKDHGNRKFSDHIIQTAKDYDMDPQTVQDILMITRKLCFIKNLKNTLNIAENMRVENK